MYKTSAYGKDEGVVLSEVFGLDAMATTLYDDLVIVTVKDDLYFKPEAIEGLEKVIEEHKKKTQRYEVATVLRKFADIDFGDLR